MATKTHQMEFLLQAQLGSSYSATVIRNYLNGTCYSSIQDNLRAVIKPVTKFNETFNNTGAVNKYHEYNPSTENLFLLTLKEIGITGVIGVSASEAKGTTYPYFSTASTRIKRLGNGSGNNSGWYTRSGVNWYSTGGKSGFYAITETGGYSQEGGYTLKGVCFGFCI